MLRLAALLACLHRPLDQTGRNRVPDLLFGCHHEDLVDAAESPRARSDRERRSRTSQTIASSTRAVTANQNRAEKPITRPMATVPNPDIMPPPPSIIPPIVPFIMPIISWTSLTELPARIRILTAF